MHEHRLITFFDSRIDLLPLRFFIFTVTQKIDLNFAATHMQMIEKEQYLSISKFMLFYLKMQECHSFVN